MKKSAYKIRMVGSQGMLEVEIMVDINRDLTDTDNDNLEIAGKQIIASLLEESIRLNPNSKKESEENKSAIVGLFENRAIFVEEIPNGYCSNYCCKHLPWFVITTNKGRIEIGWRKRVLVIDWKDSTIKESAEDLFPNEDVTKDKKLIHAWGYEKAREYIDILLKK